jgi:predicted small secreted protein
MREAKKLMLLAALVLVAAATLTACGSSDDTTTATGSDKTAAEEKAPAGGEPTASADDVPTIVVREGEPVGGVQKLEFDAGEQVRFRVSSDAAEEIHVHGYDIAKDVPAGGTVEFAFPAELEGIYEAELEGLGVQIAELQINP